MKRIFTLMLALTMCLGLAACGSLDRKWRDTDEIDAYGTVMRNGAQIDVCVCHDQKAVYLYYNDEKHELFDTAKLPTDEIYDYDKDSVMSASVTLPATTTAIYKYLSTIRI